MGRVEGSIHVNRPAQEVWDYITQVDRIPEWTTGAYGVENISDTPIKVGSTFRTVFQLEGVEVTVPHEVTELKPPHRWRMKIHYKTVGFTTWNFASEDGGTKVSASVEHNFGERKQKTLIKELQFLKQVLETGEIPDASLRGKVDFFDLVKEAVLMDRIEESIYVDRPVQEIWDYIIQVDKIVEWAAGASGVVDVSDTPIKVGTTFSTVYTLDGKEIKGHHEVTELESPNKWRMKIHYTIVGFATWDFISESGGTRISASIEDNFNESLPTAIRKELQFLKQVLETSEIPAESLRGKEQW